MISTVPVDSLDMVDTRISMVAVMAESISRIYAGHKVRTSGYIQYLPG